MNDEAARVAPSVPCVGGQDLPRSENEPKSSPAPENEPCRTCGGYGFVAYKRSIDDGWGEVDICPDCD